MTSERVGSCHNVLIFGSTASILASRSSETRTPIWVCFVALGMARPYAGARLVWQTFDTVITEIGQIVSIGGFLSIESIGV